MKEEARVQTGVPTAEDLELIGRYTRRTLAAEEVYTFPVILCDNDIDRDGERFSVPALEKLAQLFVGRTGIFDHDPKGKNQTARIYRCQVERQEGKQTAAGEPYHCLRASAYLLRTAGNQDLIREIDGGIKKEVSVGCSVGRAVCSICGADRRKDPCHHRPGEIYEGKICHVVLEDPTDAYEWSFVAVPAQPQAGVTKGYAGGGIPRLEKAVRAGAGATLSPGEAEALWTLAKEGRLFRERAVEEAVRISRLSVPGLDRKVLEKALGRLTAEELENWCQAHRRRAAGRMPLPQTAGAGQAALGENDSFKV
ncbi:MAG: hypothetical protein HFF10_05850 [Angelakisella sp.]|jgi:hypothetical protein|nr:hypothetical protein [Angelakisella sp.]